MNRSLEPRRHLGLGGSFNVRDIGGFVTADGRTTRWKMLLRSDNLHALLPESQEYLIAYGVRTIIDLRSDNELCDSPDVFERSANVRYCHHNMVGGTEPDNFDGPREEIRAALNLRDEAEGPLNGARTYCMWLDFRRAAIREILALIATPTQLPALYHCAGGADRTGVITALVLGLAGVSAETIVEDYVATARYLFQRDRHNATCPAWEKYAEDVCPQGAMSLTLEYLDERYGGIEPYVLSIGVTPEQIEAIRLIFLE